MGRSLTQRGRWRRPDQDAEAVGGGRKGGGGGKGWRDRGGRHRHDVAVGAAVDEGEGRTTCSHLSGSLSPSRYLRTDKEGARDVAGLISRYFGGL